jgi:hypothetical protein
MRILLPFVVVLFFGKLSAQVPNCSAPTPYAEEAYHILKNIDKSQIPTSILYEAVFPWANIDLFDGSTSTDTTNSYHFFQSYAELYYSSYSRANMIHPTELETNILNFGIDKDFHHAVGVIDYNFNSLDSNSVINGILSESNGQLFDVPGRSQSPYLTNRAFISSVLQAGSLNNFYSGTHYFYFQPSFTFSNRGTQISDYEYIDFYLDGNFMQRNYTFGNNTLLIGLTFPDYEGKSILTINYHKASGSDDISRINIKRKIFKNFTSCNGLNQVYTTGDAFDGGYGKGAYGSQGRGYIFFGNGNCATQQLRKPIIFVDGFDPTNSRNAWSIWESRINAPVTDINGNIVLFGDELRANGYDVIIYDYDEAAVNRGGGGFIENNGIGFVKFLQTLYSQHQSTIQQDFIIIAPSMAALVVRYGLAWAEKQNISHHAALYISFDGPHQGAHVTAGIQQTIDTFTQYGGLKAIGNLKNGIHQTNAAKQMLLNHSSQESESAVAHPYRQIFLNNLEAVGSYPQNVRKIAIVDGNRNGILKSEPVHGYDPCDELVKVRIKRRFKGFCKNCDKLAVDVYAQTDNNRCKSLNFAVQKDALVLMWLAGKRSTETISYYSQPVFTSKSFDKAPGAMFGPEIEFEELDPFQNMLTWIITGNLKIEKNLMPKSNFLPSVSSVDYTFPNNEPYDIYKNFQGINLSRCAGTTPFDTVYALAQDFNHARIDEILLEVFRNEIYNLKPKSNCLDPDCPDYITLNTATPTGQAVLKRAKKAIFMEPDFRADAIGESVVFKAAIGCDQTMLNRANQPQPQQKPTVFNDCTQNALDWDAPEVTCGSGTTTFVPMVKNLDINSYAEFSIDSVNWTRANILDRGYTLTLPNNPGQAQVFWARSADNPGYVIGGYLGYCN